MQSLLHHISQYSPLDAPSIEALRTSLQKKHLAKGDFLTTEGKICDHVYFLEKGCLRGYYNLDGKEVSYWFALENNFVTSFYSFISRHPCVENIQAVEDCVMWGISHKQLQSLYDKSPGIERLGRVMIERYYMMLEERFARNHFKEARERYDNLMTHSPEILQRIPLRYIASYLGITQETLSRIRSKG
ncbi:MAG TPA: Crp/Fnr family transcriptional regulator [Cyclobacteriaceae bacterium]|nr:Crp/Fnr family transcriptional regulator [Cyclobacteriaceae bacterium]